MIIPILKLTEQNTQLENNLNELKTKYSDLEQELNDVQNDLDKEIDELKNKLNNINNDINLNNANYEKELSLKEQKSEFLSKKLEDMKKELNELKESFEDKLNQTKEEVATEYTEKIENIKKEKEKKVKIDLNNLRICEEIFNKFKFNSAYQNYSKEKIYDGEFMKHPAFTSRTKYFKKTIDYIFFSDNLKLRKILKLPNSYEVDKEKFLPSKEFPSDHLKLFAQFYM